MPTLLEREGEPSGKPCAGRGSALDLIPDSFDREDANGTT